MSHELLPYTVKPHPLTGMYSGKLGTWMFLASEVMLFGAFFSSYILLRVMNPAWPAHGETGLNIPLGLFNTFVLIGSSVTMVLAWLACKEGDILKAHKWLLFTVALASLFLVIKIFFEYIPKIQHDHIPSHSTFYALYFLITGLHGLHVVGGIIVISYFLGPGSKLWAENPEYYTNRLECTGLYWHFVDIVWIFLFPVLYLL